MYDVRSSVSPLFSQVFWYPISFCDCFLTEVFVISYYYNNYLELFTLGQMLSFRHSRRRHAIFKRLYFPSEYYLGLNTKCVYIFRTKVQNKYIF